MRGGTAEIQVRLSELQHLHAETGNGRHPAWKPVITELARHATATGLFADPAPQQPGQPATRTGGGHTRAAPAGGGSNAPRPASTGPGPRTARGQLRRHVQARARCCLFNGCRHSAIRCHVDHRRQWQHGGATRDANLDPLCPHDHDAKDEGGWKIIVTGDGTKVWVSPLGCRYPIQPKPVLDDLPAPLARAYDPWDLATEQNDGDTHNPDDAEPSWERQTEPRPQPPANPRYIELDNQNKTARTPQIPRPPPGESDPNDIPPF